MAAEQPMLWIAWRVVHEMLRDRGYVVDAAEIEISEADFAARFGGTAVGGVKPEALNFSTHLEADPARRVSVIFFDGSRPLGQLSDLIDGDPSMTVVIVSLDAKKLGLPALPILRRIFKPRVDLFKVDELLFILPRLFLKGLERHDLLTSEEMRNLFNGGTVKKHQISEFSVENIMLVTMGFGLEKLFDLCMISQKHFHLRQRPLVMRKAWTRMTARMMQMQLLPLST